mmetsp:Transcript_9201/g.28617  ORF Transcript_9201/g.28617 Transcript_9201/m.28617 type:complete len:212 (-) Transcript_9201:513-1148(-)
MCDTHAIARPSSAATKRATTASARSSESARSWCRPPRRTTGTAGAQRTMFCSTPSAIDTSAVHSHAAPLLSISPPASADSTGHSARCRPMSAPCARPDPATAVDPDLPPLSPRAPIFAARRGHLPLREPLPPPLVPPPRALSCASGLVPSSSPPVCSVNAAPSAAATSAASATSALSPPPPPPPRARLVTCSCAACGACGCACGPAKRVTP